MRFARVVLVALLLCGCRRGSTHSSTGEVIALDPGAPSITLRHDDIPGLMGAMTMTFPVYDAKLLAGLAPGTRVQFQVVRNGDALVVTYLRPAGAAARPQRGVHDHTPHHGGVVTMVGMLHLEAIAEPPGRVRVYLSDVWRMPLPVAGASGTVTIGVGADRRELPLVAREDALEADGIALAGRALAVHVRVRRDAIGEPVEAHFMLPVAGASAGAAGIPLDGCVPQASPDAAPRHPRCVLRFAPLVTSIAATPDGRLALVAVSGAGVSVWRMPAGEFVRGLAAAPAVAVPAEAAPHPDQVGVMAVSPDGREVATAVENRLPIFAVDDGRFLRELPAYRGVIRSLAWSPDGRRLLVSLLYDPAAHLIAADDGQEILRLEVEREAAAVALSPDGRLAAVASELGPISVFTLPAGEALPVLYASDVRARSLEFAGGRLVSGSDGLRVWDVLNSRMEAQASEAVVARLAVAPGGRLVAATSRDHAIGLHDVATGATLETLTWHRAPVWGLAWAGSTLLSGDADGNVALWDVAR
jgi:Cu/Ag efflux protein CusF